MKESQLLGEMLPTSPDFQPIVREIRRKYKIPEIVPEQDEPIAEIYLGDRIVPLEEFRQDIEDRVRANLLFIPPETVKLYKNAKAHYGKPLDWCGYEMIPEQIRKPFEDVYKLSQDMSAFIIKIVDAQIVNITDMLYTYILTGESQEVPNDWISKVVTMTMAGEPMVVALASQVANPEVIVQQFRQQFDKTFGAHRPKLTNKVVSTAYYLQLQRLGKPWNYIVREFITRNKYPLPRDVHSKRYQDTWRKYEQRLRKRIRKTETVLDILVREKIPKK